MKNECGVMRKVDNPYEIWEGVGQFAGWTWKVLKKYQTPENEAKNPYARWLCAVSSPFTAGGEDWGDTYIKDITPYARMIKGKPDLRVVMREDINKQNLVDKIFGG
jgi:hypothetical protein